MSLQAPVLVRMHPADNVAIVGNEGGLPAGTLLSEPAPGLVLRERVPQAHKVALVDIPEGGSVKRSGVTMGHARRDPPAGSWVPDRVTVPQQESTNTALVNPHQACQAPDKIPSKTLQFLSRDCIPKFGDLTISSKCDSRLINRRSKDLYRRSITLFT